LLKLRAKAQIFSSLLILGINARFSQMPGAKEKIEIRI
jgi:hypothetical protein